MKETFVVIIILGVLGVLLTGGFSTKDPKGLLSSQQVTQLIGPTIGLGNKTLQLNNQIAVSPAPSPSNGPSPSPSQGPSPSPSNGPSPSPSVPANTCNSKVAIDFLLDVSGSMYRDIDPNPPYRIDQLKTAMAAFGNHLTGNDVVGIQVFSSPGNPNCSGAGAVSSTGASCEVLHINSFNSGQYQQKVSSLLAGGQTFTKDAFAFIGPIINIGINQYSEYKWFLVFLSDGVPNPYLDQYPFRLGNVQLQDVVTPIKSNPKIKIITIGLGNPGTDYDDGLMRDIASIPSSTYFHHSATGSDLSSVFNDIFTQTCTNSP